MTEPDEVEANSEPEEVGDPTPTPTRQSRKFFFLSVLVAYGAIAGIYLILMMPLGFLGWHLPTAFVAGWVIARCVRGFESRRWGALLVTSALISVSLGVGYPALEARHAAIRKHGPVENPMFGLSRQCEEWISGHNVLLSTIAVLFYLPAVVCDVLMLPVTFCVLLANSLEAALVGLQLSGVGLLLALPSLVGLALLNRRLLSRAEPEVETT